MKQISSPAKHIAFSNSLKPAMATTDSKVKLKLLVDIRAKRVLFAEAGKDFVDFLFYILSLPVGTVVNLLKSRGMVGCLGALRESLENLSETYMQPNQNKDVVLNPESPSCSAAVISLKLTCNTSETRKFYRCPNSCTTYSDNQHKSTMTDVRNMRCPRCSIEMSTEMHYVTPKSTGSDAGAAVVGGGFVKGVVTYMVMDDLQVKPMSTISSITMLNKFNIKDVGSLEERVVEIGTDEGLKLLKASFESKEVLASVFVEKYGIKNKG